MASRLAQPLQKHRINLKPITQIITRSRECIVNSKAKSEKSNLFYIKTERTFTRLRKYAWLFLLIAPLGAWWFPVIGLSIIPLMLALTVLAFFNGKYWCGNICPHGSLFDGLILSVSKNRRIPKLLKNRWFAGAVFTWFMVMLGLRLYKVLALWGDTTFAERLGYIFTMNYTIVTVVGIVLAITIAPRSWCSFCPMGTMEKLSYKLGKFLKLNSATDCKVSVAHEEMCHQCGKCSRVCPVQLTPYLEFDENGQFSNENCIRCETCVNNCPANILTVKNAKIALNDRENVNLEGYDKKVRTEAEISKIEDLTEDTRKFTFKLQHGDKMVFKGGQFILLKIHNELEMFRAYSIAGFNDDGTEFSVIVKKAPNGFGTGIIFDAFSIGDLIEVNGPMGDEIVIKNGYSELLFIAGGIGITPFIPLVDEVLKDESIKSVKLVHGVNFKKDFLYQKEFESKSSSDPRFDYFPVAASCDSWAGEKGFVTDIINKLDINNSHKVLMCGPPPMIDASLDVLQIKHVEQENIYFESA